MPTIIFVDVWLSTAFVVLIILAGLQSVPEDIQEAATVDGATYFQRLRHVVLPMIKPFIMLAILFRVMDAIKRFDTIFIMTGGGPGQATETLDLHAFFTGFQNFQIGAGARIALIMLLFSLSISRSCCSGLPETPTRPDKVETSPALAPFSGAWIDERSSAPSSRGDARPMCPGSSASPAAPARSSRRSTAPAISRCRWATTCSCCVAWRASSPTWATTACATSSASSGTAASTRTSATSRAACCPSPRSPATISRPGRPPLLRRHPEQQIERVRRPLPRLPDRLLALRTGVDAARAWKT